MYQQLHRRRCVDNQMTGYSQLCITNLNYFVSVTLTLLYRHLRLHHKPCSIGCRGFEMSDHREHVDDIFLAKHRPVSRLKHVLPHLHLNTEKKKKKMKKKKKKKKKEELNWKTLHFWQPPEKQVQVRPAETCCLQENFHSFAEVKQYLRF